MIARILVADDVRDAADATAALLGCDGHEVLAVYDGLQAVEAARHFRPDLIILDLNMPTMDGYEAAAVLRREQPEGSSLVLVALTGRTDPDDRERCRRAGFDHHVGKPLHDDICTVIDGWLRAADTGNAAAPSD